MLYRELSFNTFGLVGVIDNIPSVPFVFRHCQAINEPVVISFANYKPEIVDNFAPNILKAQILCTMEILAEMSIKSTSGVNMNASLPFEGAAGTDRGNREVTQGIGKKIEGKVE